MNDLINGINSKIFEREKLALLLKEKYNGKKVVFTNGCFDILHKGHLILLSECKKFGDILVVALNSDLSVRKLKGSNRPINAIEDRMFILASIFFVDFVTWFEENDPVETIRIIKPNIHVKGGDYKPEDLIEYDILNKMGIELKIIPYINGYSTTNIIKKMSK
ncbi:MAG: D-glycero-beta-D-manno-heptose 1-phosphate adenylyltransferase [Spirochaetes bacterium]|nr:D-glycero-beta-D-manno-heptose 1-phosphate adenylyltransferase [Spirochaetota bacterium]